MKRVNGTGSVHKVKGNKSKPWRATATVGFDEGKQKKIVIGTYKTKREAEAALEAHRKMDGRIDISRDLKINVLDLINRWLDTRRSLSGNKKPLSSSTISTYEDARGRLSPIHKMVFSDLSIDDLQDAFDDLIEKKYSRSAVRHCRTLLTQVYDYAIPRGLATVNLAKHVKLDMRAPTPTSRFTSEELRILFEHDQEPWVDVILIMIFTAMRPTELLTLPKSRVDLDQWTITWGIKTDAGIDRLIPIHPFIRPYITARMKHRGDLLIQGLDVRQGRQDRLYEITARKFNTDFFKPTLISINITRPLTARVCRKTGSSLFAEAGMSKSARIKILGHTDIALTEKVYTALEVDYLAQEMSKIS